MTKKQAAAGTWNSPLTAESLASAGIRLAQPCIEGTNTYWLEGRPTERGRSVLVVCDKEGNQRDLTPAPWDVRSRVHEYGGSAYLVSHGHVFFVNAKDQGIYRIDGDTINKVFQHDQLRFANLALDPVRQRLVAVAEHHEIKEEPENLLVSINLQSGALTTLHSGADFYSSPTFNSDCSRIAFLSWMHPHMPWNETTLHTADIDDQHKLHALSIVSEGSAAFLPKFGPDDQLYFVNDRKNWWNLYVRGETGVVKPLTQIEGELGMPHWIFGMSTFGFSDDNTIVAACTRHGLWQLISVDIHSGTTSNIEPWEYTAIEHLAVNKDGVVCHAASPTLIDSIIRVDLSEGKSRVVRKASDFSLPDDMISSATPVTFGEAETTAYGFHYAPQNSQHELPGEDKPPLIVLVHGGPTAATGNGLNPRIQFWTTRGFAVLDVNYRGSTGFGRDFRHSLNGQWGVFDVEDCVNGAQHLIDEGKVHPDQIYIMGGSAGGYTVLGALTFTDFFAGGISLYGIGDLALLMQDTHKFEARYTDTLVAPYDEALYKARSPLFAADQIRVPVLFFQGTDDKMVPPNQAETMVQALRENEVPVGYVLFDGEGHGFRREDSIITLMNTSLQFFSRIMGHSLPPDATLKLYNSDKLD
ncbi:MAG: prolyl oligopeptidase family serine peptidase [Gammaproteobacteria bacterium]